MNLTEIISGKAFREISNRFLNKTSVPLFLINRDGSWVYTPKACRICRALSKHKNYNRLSTACRENNLLLIRESGRWGDVYISTCPLGLIVCMVSLGKIKDSGGGMMSGSLAVPEMVGDMKEEIQSRLSWFGITGIPGRTIVKNLRITSRSRLAGAARYLLKLTEQYQFVDREFLVEQREKSLQQVHIASFLEELKKQDWDVGRMILDKESEIFEQVKLGDLPRARRILNEFLGSILFKSGMRFDLMKMRLIEFCVIISRAATVSGVSPDEILGLNFSYLTELSDAGTIEDLCFKVNRILANFITRIKAVTVRKKRTASSRMEEYIRGHFTGKLSAASVARQAGLSVSRALHLFREETGMSLSGYITGLRVQYSRYLLARTDMPLLQVALESGFYDQSHFTRHFRKIEGTTPSRYRKKQGEKVKGKG